MLLKEKEEEEQTRLQARCHRLTAEEFRLKTNSKTGLLCLILNPALPVCLFPCLGPISVMGLPACSSYAIKPWGLVPLVCSGGGGKDADQKGLYSVHALCYLK